MCYNNYINLNNIGVENMSNLDELKEKSIEYAKEVILSYIPKDKINQLLLYGSFARNMATYKSDVDMALFIKPDTLTIKQKRQLKSEAMPLDIHLPEVDLHIFDGFLNEYDDTYFNAIKRDGKELTIGK